MKIGLFSVIALAVAAIIIAVAGPFHQSGTRAERLEDKSGALAASQSVGSPAIASLGTAGSGASGTAAGASSPAASSSAASSVQPAASSAPLVKGGCAVSPHQCGYPDATNTGVPASVKLLRVPGQISRGKGWHYDSRGWVEVDGNGAVLRGLYIPYDLDISASNVTVTDVEVVDTGNGFGISLRHTNNVTISHSAVSSPYASGANRLQVGIKDIYADSVNTVIEYDNIWHTSTAVQISEGLVMGNYIHDMGYTSGDHLDGIASDAGDSHGLTINHNTVFVHFGQTTAVGLFEDFGAQFNCLIENNLIAGGGYALYGGANPGGAPTSNIRVVGNRFARIYSKHSGYYGPFVYFDAHKSSNKWSGNVWDDTGKPLPA